MFIKEIKDYDKDSSEATVIVSDGRYEMACYAGFFEFKENQKFKLVTFLAKNIMIAESLEASIEKKDGYYEYKLIGKIINKDTKEIGVGKIIIELDGHIPNDLHDGDFVELECLRVDFL